MDLFLILRSLAQLLGVSELVIGLTIIAAGTSLPEVVTSIVATIHGEREIAIGNIVGTNLFNLLTGICQYQGSKKLLVAPFDLHKRMVALIERESAKRLAQLGGSEPQLEPIARRQRDS